MSEDRRDGGHAQSITVSDRSASRSYRLYLLLGSGAAFALGGFALSAAGRFGWGPYAPIEAILLGFALLVGAALPEPSGDLSSDKQIPRASAASPGNGHATPPGFSRGVEASSDTKPPSLKSALPKKFEASVTAPPTYRQSPGDFLWSSWESSTGRLPVELVGPVPETAYEPPRPGGVLLHEEGEPILLETSYFDDENLEWAWGSSWPGPCGGYSQSMSGPTKDQPVWGPSPSSSMNASQDLANFGPHSPERDPQRPVLHEALDPTPPDLRLAPANRRIKVAPRPRPPSPNGRSRCANCRTAIPEPKAWRRCPDCQHPLCTHCIVEALMAYEGGWCAHCAGLRHLDLLSKELGPAGRFAAHRKVHRASPPINRPTGAFSNSVGRSVRGWKEPDWFVSIPAIRKRSASMHPSNRRQGRARLENLPSVGAQRAHGDPTPNRGPAGLSVAGI